MEIQAEAAWKFMDAHMNPPLNARKYSTRPPTVLSKGTGGGGGGQQRSDVSVPVDLG